ncbi:flippase [Ligilactobacillus agilis]|uniref:Flippase n=1 Tax=Ligilactobacillus agilis TaxID=1601 RepID=A0A2I2ADN4_9LACO|nr:flippase [Ligilactobacillus agilis]PLA77489.1 flippase [Ligilactobacillus agilis]PLA83127.1 flippase [Ligilactobacillus agilis]
MKVVRNYLYNAGYQILALIIPLITAPYISRTLKPHGVGIYADTNAWIQWFVLIASIGIALYGNREIAYVRDDKEKMSRTFWEIQIVKLVMTLVAYIALVIFLQIYTKYTWYIWVQSINILAATLDISWLYMGLEDFKRTVIRNTGVKILSLVLILTFVKTPNDVALYIFLTGFSILLGNLTLWPRLRIILTRVKLSSLRPLRHLKPSLALFVPQIATQIYLILNKNMLGIIVNSTAVGYYNNSDSLVKMVLALVTATGTVMLPHVASEFAKGNKEAINEMLYSSFDFVSFLSVAMAFGLAAVGLHGVPYFYGEGFAPVGPAIMIESAVIVIIGWSNAIGIQYLLPTDRVKEFSTSVIIGAVVNFILNFPLMELWGLKGAMISTVLSEAMVTGYQFWTIRNDIEYKRLFTNIWKYLLSGLIMFIPVSWLDRNLHTGVFSILLEVVVGILVYLLMILILKPTILTKTKSLLKNRK